MSRIVVLGGRGFFGGAVVELLRDGGVDPIVASRGSEVRIDAENADSIRRGIRRGDVVIDAAGPFQDRSTALVEAAIEIGFDVVDLSDSLDYALRVAAMAEAIERAGIRVLPSCSSASAVTAFLIREEAPKEAAIFLAPATRLTANSGAGRSLLRSIGRPIRVFREGRLVERPGWRESRVFPMPEPIGELHGRLFESADSIWLARRWPSLRRVDFFVDTRIPALNGLFDAASRSGALRGIVETLEPLGLAAAKRLGSESGGIAVEVDGKRRALVAETESHFVAAIPAALAARSIVEGRFERRGLVAPGFQVDPRELQAEFERRRIALLTW